MNGLIAENKNIGEINRNGNINIGIGDTPRFIAYQIASIGLTPVCPHAKSKPKSKYTLKITMPFLYSPL